MSRVIAILAVLSLSAAAFAGPAYTIENLQVSPAASNPFGVDVFYFDIVLASTDGLTLPGDAGYNPPDHNISALGIGCTIGGSAASKLTADNSLNQISGTNWQMLISADGGNYMLFGFSPAGAFPSPGGVTSTSMASGMTTTQAMVEERGNPLIGVPAVLGDVIARFYWKNTGGLTAADFGNLTLTMHDDALAPTGKPYFLTPTGGTTADQIPLDLIPEPATMGLLGLGLLGLVIRRKK